jgi:hypothetical protein
LDDDNLQGSPCQEPQASRAFGKHHQQSSAINCADPGDKYMIPDEHRFFSVRATDRTACTSNGRLVPMVSKSCDDEVMKCAGMFRLFYMVQISGRDRIFAVIERDDR